MIPEKVFSETLLGFLAPVRHFLEDPSVSEVMINGPDQIFVERKGKLELTEVRFPSAESVMCALRNAAQYVGKHVDEQHPILEARLPDGSRLQALVSPVAPGGPFVAIRRFSKESFSLDKLVELGTLSADAVAALDAFVAAKLNVLVAGGTGSGKTSLLNALTRFIPEGERIVVIEDAKEVQVQHRHVVQLESRPADPDGRGAVSIRELFRATLRLRPDRIVIGEIRGGEALDIVQAMVSGHGGCLATLHATYPRDTLTRLETMALMSDVDLPLAALRAQIASGVNIIVQVARVRDGARKVTHITEVRGFDLASGRYELADLFALDVQAKVGGLVPTGTLPQCSSELAAHGKQLPKSLLEAARRKEQRR